MAHFTTPLESLRRWWKRRQMWKRRTCWTWKRKGLPAPARECARNSTQAVP